MVAVVAKMTMIDTDEDVVARLKETTTIEDTGDVGVDDVIETTTVMMGVALLLKIIVDAVVGVTGPFHLHKIGIEIEGDTGRGPDLDQGLLDTDEKGDQTDVLMEIVTATTLCLLFHTVGRFSFLPGLLLV